VPRNQLFEPRQGTAAAWTAANPVLGAQEMGLETDTRLLKFGDGATAWSGLPYANSGTTITSPAPTSGAPGQPLTVGGTPTNTTLLGTPRDEYFLSDYGISGNFADHASAINSLLPAIALAQGGGAPSYECGVAACLPHGSLVNSIPLVVPTLCQLRGMGWFYYGSSVQIGTNANCDTVQFFESPDQVQSNAFFCKLSDVFVNGNSPNQAAGDWHSWLNITTNPGGGTATHDPNFDPQHRIEHVWGQSASGDGLYQYLRSETVCEDVWSFSNGGSGFIAGADSEFAQCKAQGNQLGGYVFPYSDASIVGCHSYNNGYAAQYIGLFITGSGTTWTLALNHAADNGTFTITVSGVGTTAAIAYNATAATIEAAINAVAGGTVTGATGGPLKSGGNYAAVVLTFASSQATAPTVAQSQSFGAGQAVIYNGDIYKALNNLNGYTGNPSTDATNWAAPSRALNTSRSLAGNLAPDWGVGYLVWGAQLICMSSCTAITNAGYGVYLKNSIGCNVQLAVGTVNCNAANGVAYPTNPLNLACACLDNSYGSVVEVSCYNNANAYALRLVNGADDNTIIVNTDGSEMGLLSPDSALLNNTIIYNGAVMNLVDGVLVANVTGATYAMPNGYGQYLLTLEHTLGAACTITPPSAVAGKSTLVVLLQDSTGGVSWSFSGVKWPAHVAPTPTTTASAEDLVALDSADGAAWLGSASLNMG
jgi:hypothetical protein